MSAARKAGSDGSLIAWNSPGTQIDHNSLLLNGNEFYAVEFRFSSTTNGTARNNLADAGIHLRDNAAATTRSNLVTAVPEMFASPAIADLHLLSSTTNAIDRGLSLSSITNDIDGDRRPRGASSDIGADEFSTTVPPRVSNLKLLGPNALISLTTLPGESYDVLRASNPAEGQWAVVASNLAGASHDIEVTDAQGASRGTQFYRGRLSP